MNVANQALFINMASVLWAVNIEKALDASGQVIIPSRTDCIDEGLVVYVLHFTRRFFSDENCIFLTFISSRPVPFKCLITARSKDRPSIIEMSKTKLHF